MKQNNKTGLDTTPSCASSAVHIVMIGPHGERDYVEFIFRNQKPHPSGMPCLCGNSPSTAGAFKNTEAEQIKKVIMQFYLPPHVSVELEPIQ